MKVSKLCRMAFLRQGGLCHYCGLPMIPRKQLEQFATLLALSSSRVMEVTATAEHLKARCEGGTDTAENIAAAHLVCNQRRHHLRPAPDPDKYKAMVERKLAQGSWLKKAIRQRLDSMPSELFIGD